MLGSMLGFPDLGKPSFCQGVAGFVASDKLRV